MSDRTPEPVQSLTDAIKNALESTIADIHTGFPAVVQSFDAELQEADLVPVIKRKKVDSTSEERFKSLPLLPSVPVIYPSSIDSSIYFPLKKGDSVWVLVSERSVDGWRPQGNVQANPAVARKFDLTDVYCVPGAKADNARLPANRRGVDLILHHKGKEVRITADDKILLGSEGSAATEAVVLGDTLKTKLEAILDILITGDHVLTTSPGNPSAPNPTRATQLTTIKNSLSSTLSAIARVE